MIRLSKPQILLLHEQLIAETGGSSGLRNEGMLDSALHVIYMSGEAAKTQTIPQFFDWGMVIRYKKHLYHIKMPEC